MIPKIIHYCWFGRGPMPQLALDCIESWHRAMPDWDYMLWNEDNFDVNIIPYTQEAYAAKKYAFVSDYARLWALQQYGGVYLDVDFFVYKSFDTLLLHNAFAGFEGSKHLPVMMGVCASIPNGEWVNEMVASYNNRHFNTAGSLDMTTNVTYLTHIMRQNGLQQNGKEQEYKDLHIFPTEYFCPHKTTGEYIKTANTYCEHKGLDSWSGPTQRTLKTTILKIAGPRLSIGIIKLKRRLIG